MLFLALLFFLLSLSEDDLSIGGVVFNPAGTAVSEASVILEHTTDRRRWETSTNADGSFRFERLALGTYRLHVNKGGFFEAITDMRLEASKFIELTLATVETVNTEIEVIARPDPINTETVAVQRTVNDEVLQNIPYPSGRNFLNAVALMPGVLRDNLGQIHIHGSRSDQVRYQLDGMNLTDPSSGNLSSNIPIDAIESVDLDLAGYSAELGKGSGGVVRVNSQFVGNNFRWDLTDFIPGVNFKRRTIADFAPRALASGPLVAGKAWFVYSGMLKYIRTFNEELPDPDNRQNQTLSDQLLKLQWNLREAHVLTFNLLHNAEYFGNAGLSPNRPLETTTNWLKRGANISLSDRNVLSGALLETTVQWSRRRDSELAKGKAPLQITPGGWTGNYFADRAGQTQRFRAAHTVSWERPWLETIHRFKTGAEFDYVISGLDLERRPFQLYGREGGMRSSVTFEGPASARIHNREYGAFLQDRLVLSRLLQVELGMRFDREYVTGRNNFSPRAAVSWLPFAGERAKITAGIGLFHDNVSLLDLQLARMQRRVTTYFNDSAAPSRSPLPTGVFVSPNLHNPSGLHWNVAWDHEWAPRWVTRVNYIQKNGRNQVRFSAVPRENGFDLRFGNSGRSEYKAIEVALDRPIRTNLRILASYTYSRAKARPTIRLDFPDPAVESVANAPVEWDAPHRFVTWGYFPFFFGLSASYSAEARSGFPFTAMDDLNLIASDYNAYRFPTFFVTSVSLEREIPALFGKRLGVRIGVTNLFNRFNPRFVDGNVNSPNFGQFADSSDRHFVGRIRLIKK